MKNKWRNRALLLLFLTGFVLVFYPVVKGINTKHVSEKVIKEFDQVAEEFQSADVDRDETESGADTTARSRQLYNDMKAYNKEIYENGQANLKDPFTFETPAFRLTSYGFDSDVAGYVSIPRMGVELPIYLGASTANMALGAVNLGYTSTPIGGVNTNTVLAAHRGYGGTAMFRDIEAMQSGDKVYLTNLWETLTYKVVETKVISPTDVDEIRIQEGKDMLTLITCHPYTKNYQRYVVYCERTENDPAEEGKESSGAGETGLELTNILQWNELSDSQRLIFAEKWIPIGIAAVLLVLLVFRGRFWLRWKRRAKKSG